MNRTMKKRMLGAFAIFIAAALALTGSMIRLYVVDGETYRQMALAQQTKDELVSSRRGTIYDRNLKQLAVSITADTVVIDPTTIRNAEREKQVAQDLSAILGLEYDDVYAMTQKNNSYEIVKKRITQEQSQAISELESTVGITLVEDSKRNYVYGTLASNVLGFTGYDNQGLDGIELVADEILRGTSGRIRVATTQSGTEMPFPYESYIDPIDGQNIVLTIDEVIQHFAESALNEAVEKYGAKEGGCLLVMNPQTAEILAMAVTPGYDPNAPFEIYNPALLETIEQAPEEEKSDALFRAQNKQWRNRAVSDTYEPGSVFKMITAASALEEGVTSLNDSFVCTGSRQVDTWKIDCWRYYNPHGTQTLAEGLQNSCNPVFMELGLRMGGDTMKKYIQAFGFESQTGFVLPGEAEPIIRSSYNEVDTATAAFGQNINITPLQMITAASAVVNGGRLLKPQIIKQYIDDDGNVIKNFEPELVRQVISEDTSAMMRSLLENVVENGTGSGARIKGQRVGGKTGTSEKQPRGSGKKIASFCGFAPANDPQVIMLLLLDEATPGMGEGNLTAQGGQIAAPTAGLVLDEILRYLEIEPQYSSAELMTADTDTPNLVGLTTEEAQVSAENASMTVRIIGNGGTIVDQQPKAGIIMPSGSMIVAYTEGSSESQSVTVPDVVGRSKLDATSILKAASLNLKVSDVGDSGGNAGAVAIEQSPQAGTVVEKGSVVSVRFRIQDVD